MHREDRVGVDGLRERDCRTRRVDVAHDQCRVGESVLVDLGQGDLLRP
jgi:hypothetical protein